MDTHQKSKINNIKWVGILTIFWIVLTLIIIIAILLIKSVTYGLMISIIGILMIFFNGKMYRYMVKWNVWWSRKIGVPKIGKEVKSNFFRKFYRTIIFLSGLLVLGVGIFLILLEYGIDLRTLF